MWFIRGLNWINIVMAGGDLILDTYHHGGERKEEVTADISRENALRVHVKGKWRLSHTPAKRAARR